MFTMIIITFRQETYVKRFPGVAQVSFDLHYSPPLWYERITVSPRKKGNLIDRAFITVAYYLGTNLYQKWKNVQHWYENLFQR